MSFILDDLSSSSDVSDEIMSNGFGVDFSVFRDFSISESHRSRGKSKEWNLISCGKSKHFNLWNWRKEEHIGEVPDAHSGMILSILEYGKDRYVSGSCDNKIKVWHLLSEEDFDFEYEGELNAHTKDVNCLAHIRDNYIVSGSDDNTVNIWNCEKLKLMTSFTNHTNDIRDVKTCDFHTVASASYDKTVRIFDIEKKCQINILKKHTHRVRCLEVVKERDLLLSGSYGRKVMFWDLHSTSKPIHVLKDENWMNALHYYIDRHLLCTGDDVGRIGLWDIRNLSKIVRREQIHTNFVTQIITVHPGISSDVNRIASCSTDGLIVITDINTCQPEKVMRERTSTWIFGLLSHDRRKPDYIQDRKDMSERKGYLLKKYADMKIQVMNPYYYKIGFNRRNTDQVSEIFCSYIMFSERSRNKILDLFDDREYLIKQYRKIYGKKAEFDFNKWKLMKQVLKKKKKKKQDEKNSKKMKRETKLFFEKIHHNLHHDTRFFTQQQIREQIIQLNAIERLNLKEEGDEN